MQREISPLVLCFDESANHAAEEGRKKVCMKEDGDCAMGGSDDGEAEDSNDGSNWWDNY